MIRVSIKYYNVSSCGNTHLMGVVEQLDNPRVKASFNPGEIILEGKGVEVERIFNKITEEICDLQIRGI